MVAIESQSVAPDEIRDKKNDLEGIEMAELEKSEIYTLLECHVEMSITGFGEVDPETGEETGLKVPYIITLDEGSGQVLAIRRNFDADDPSKKKKDYFVHSTGIIDRIKDGDVVFIKGSLGSGSWRVRDAILSKLTVHPSPDTPSRNGGNSHAA